VVSLKQKVLDANKWIVNKNLVELTWGNVSFCDRENNKVIIKPSGVVLDQMAPHQISCVDLEGNLLSGNKPSVDTPTHIELYKSFPNINCVIHTHSKYATIFAQAYRAIPCLGTTHADYFYGDIPCIPPPDPRGVLNAYEKNTGKSINEFYKVSKIDYNKVQACVVAGHGPFVWGNTINQTLEHAYVLEIVAEYAYKSLILNPDSILPQYILDKHFLRKHGDNKYYGQ